MRIIAGQFRSRQLKSPKNLKIRPTSDMLRETLFNILGPRVEGTHFLDLFAGTGAIGIEAISRGAAYAVLVESHRPTAKLITENLSLLEITGAARVIVSDSVAAITKLESAKLEPSAAPFDFVFLDPPYANERDYHAVLQALEKSPLLTESSIVIAEHRKAFSLPVTINRLHQFRALKQGDAALTFYSR
jgi:16S rRNA (guanine966-N2)-methyltransferase